MNQDTKLIEARLDAIEAILLTLSDQDPQMLEKVRLALSRNYHEAKAKADRPDVTRLQNSIQYEMPAGRDKMGERARVEAFRRLCRDFGAQTES
ncbi:hypothetical protein [Paraburkholderia bannensis]|uniref:hypothetical protein n=1 Tax=Paraburkholderia bannensis TaxID=765414 RepID=UPI002AB6A5E0|nr:hypothetical protein [Paraburkholderia bannensis]